MKSSSFLALFVVVLALALLVAFAPGVLDWIDGGSFEANACAAVLALGMFALFVIGRRR